VLAAVESAWHLDLLDVDGVDLLREHAPGRMAPTLARLDLRSQSGFETHTRVKLEDAGHDVESQIPIPGSSDLDLLVDGCVGIETDGRKWHETRFIADRTKDLVLESWGIRTLRLGAPHIFGQWPDTLATIERMVAESPQRLRAQRRRFRGSRRES